MDARHYLTRPEYSDLRSANGVKVKNERIRGSATLADGDHIGIGGHEFTFEIKPCD